MLLLLLLLLLLASGDAPPARGRFLARTIVCASLGTAPLGQHRYLPRHAHLRT
jgi:hypothetical protein